MSNSDDDVPLLYDGSQPPPPPPPPQEANPLDEYWNKVNDEIKKMKKDFYEKYPGPIYEPNFVEKQQLELNHWNEQLQKAQTPPQGPVPSMQQGPLGQGPVMLMQRGPLGPVPVPSMQRGPLGPVPVTPMQQGPLGQGPVPSMQRGPLGPVPVPSMQRGPLGQVPVPPMQPQRRPLGQGPFPPMQQGPLGQGPVMLMPLGPLGPVPIPPMQPQRRPLGPVTPMQQGPQGQGPVMLMQQGPQGQGPFPSMPLGTQEQVSVMSTPPEQTSLGQNSPQNTVVGFDKFFKNLESQKTNPVNGQKEEIEGLIKIISKLDEDQLNKLSNEIKKLANTKSEYKEKKTVSLPGLLKNIFNKISLSPSNSPQNPTAQQLTGSNNKAGPIKTK